MKPLIRLMSLILCAVSAPAYAHTGHHHEPVPNFAASPTCSTDEPGSWSLASTWSCNRVPGENDIVTIHHRVVMDSAQAITRVTSIENGGTLTFAVDRDTQLKVKELQVKAGGRLEIGTALDPLPRNRKAEIIFRNIAIDQATDPKQYGTGLLVEGTIALYGAPLSRTFAKFAQEPDLSDRTHLLMAGDVSDWIDGDQLFLPRTESDYPESGIYRSTSEVVTVKTSAGAALELQAPMTYNHPSIRLPDGTIASYADTGALHGYAANLTRNIIVRSESATGTRAHTMYTNGAFIDIRYVRMEDLGRTTIDPLNNTVIDANGAVTNYGTNQIGRYALHIHMLGKPSTLVPTEYGPRRFALVGNAIVGSRKWAITVHDTHFGLIKHNVMHRADGAALYTETGFESNNIIEENFVGTTFGTGHDREDGRSNNQFSENGGFGGSAYWFSGPDNIVRGNVATNAATYCFSQYGMGGGNVPLSAASDETQAGQSRPMGGNTTRLREFRNNVCMASRHGLGIWNVNAQCCTGVNPAAEWSYFDGIVFAHVPSHVVYGYGSNKIVFDRWRVVGDWRMLTNRHEAAHIWFGDYLSPNTIIRNSDVIGLAVGFHVPIKVGDTSDGIGSTPRWVVIENSTFQNRADIVWSTPFGVTGGGGALPPRYTLVKNVKFLPLPGNVYSSSGHSETRLAYSYQPGGANTNIMQRDDVFVIDYNQEQGNQFKFFFPQQAPGFIVPETGSIEGLAVGAPVANRTNQELWDQFTTAIAGSVARCADTRAAVHGFACSLTAAELGFLPAQLDGSGPPPPFPTPLPTATREPRPTAGPGTPTPIPTGTPSVPPINGTPNPENPRSSAPLDFDGDGLSDTALLDTDSGPARYTVKLAGGAESRIPFGERGDIPVPGDYNRDGKTDLAVVHHGPKLEWRIREFAGSWTKSVTLGEAGDTVVGGCDLDGDGADDPVSINPRGVGRFLSIARRKVTKFTLPKGAKKVQERLSCAPIDEHPGDELLLLFDDRSPGFRTPADSSKFALSVIGLGRGQTPRGKSEERIRFVIDKGFSPLAADLGDGKLRPGYVQRLGADRFELTFPGENTDAIGFGIPGFLKLFVHTGAAGQGITLHAWPSNTVIKMDFADESVRSESFRNQPRKFQLLTAVSVKRSSK